ncbi:hypothetical protein GCM10020255_050360 [Rhodococcus baikonurensis]
MTIAPDANVAFAPHRLVTFDDTGANPIIRIPRHHRKPGFGGRESETVRRRQGQLKFLCCRQRADEHGKTE